MATTDAWNNAESAGVVAAFGDLDVGRMLGGQTETRRIVVGNERRRLRQELRHASLTTHDLMDDRDDIGDLIQADIGVDFRELDVPLSAFDDGQGTLITLRHAASNDELLVLFTGGGLAIAHLVDGLEGLVLGGVDERAGINDHHIGIGGISGHGHASLREVADHDFGIDQVLGATKGD